MSIRVIAERIRARQLIRDVYIREGLACETRQPPKLEELRRMVRRKANMRVRIPSNNNWGEPERAPHLMMSTAVCMSFCRRTYGKHSPGDELWVRVVARAL